MPHSLDENKTIHETFLTWQNSWTDHTQESRDEANIAIDYYHGFQWTSREAKQLEARGQPQVTFNRIHKKINLIIGNAISTTVDPKGLPRPSSLLPGAEGREDEANASTDAIRFVLDKNRYPRIRSKITKDVYVPGTGGIVVEIDEKRKIILRRARYGEIFHDPFSVEEDFSDAQFMGVATWWDLDKAIAKYEELAKKKKAVEDVEVILNNTLSQVAESGEGLDDKIVWADTKRKRVRVDEVYYFIDGQCWFSHYTKAGLLVEPTLSPFKDEDGNHVCPLLLTSAFATRKDKDTGGMIRYGLVRQMISPQDEVNKRRSKMLHLLNVNKTIAEEGVVESPMTAKKEDAQPDGWIVVRDGSISENRMIRENGLDVAQGHFQLLQEAKQEIDAIGPDIPNLASDDRVRSGRAILAQQQIANMELAGVNDNLNDLDYRVFIAVWQRIKQFKTQEWWVRVRDDTNRPGWRFVGLNRRTTHAKRFIDAFKRGVDLQHALFIAAVPQEIMEDVDEIQQRIQQEAQEAIQRAQQQRQEPPQITPKQLEKMVALEVLEIPEMQEKVTENDVGKMEMDIVIEVVPDTAVAEQEEHDALSRMIASSPSLQTPQVLEMLIETSVFRDKRKLIEILQQAQQPSEEQQQQAQLQVAKLTEEVKKLAAQTAKLQADAQFKLQTEPKGIEAEATRDLAHAGKLTAEAGEIVGGAVVDLPTTEQ